MTGGGGIFNITKSDQKKIRPEGELLTKVFGDKVMKVAMAGVTEGERRVITDDPAGPAPPTVEPAPQPTIEPSEIAGAKRRVKSRRGGRSSQVLAGRMMTARSNQGLKRILG
ncbi:hypothetical protein KAR91_50775 [Candidatus Pacearchaeota archaeon]|nr:hypothetical protein [Candidatus Pacearchaeota archaeon]